MSARSAPAGLAALEEGTQAFLALVAGAQASRDLCGLLTERTLSNEALRFARGPWP